MVIEGEIGGLFTNFRSVATLEREGHSLGGYSGFMFLSCAVGRDFEP